ncbi:MAG: hypothetical protein Q9169_001084 [Polycauliona sp. 2 TL-2023]
MAIYNFPTPPGSAKSHVTAVIPEGIASRYSDNLLRASIDNSFRCNRQYSMALCPSRSGDKYGPSPVTVNMNIQDLLTSKLILPSVFLIQLTGKKYTLDRLPAGYQAWERPRAANPKHVDRWLYGHPDKKGRFDSPNRFYPHFKYLMQHGNDESCQCDLCGSKGRKPVTKASTTRPPQPATKPQIRPAPLTRGPVDEEGTPDIYCSLFTLLKNEGTLSRAIEERASLDWRAERPMVREMANAIPKQPAFIPRNGEIVLYIRPLPSGIQLQLDSQTHHFSLHDTINNRPTGNPKWLAGVVTQVPSTTPKSSSLHPPPHPTTDTASLNQTGFRIEPLPSPNSSDKNLSKQHTYTPLHLIRPFTLWQILLSGISESEWHVSIHNALTASATFSLINRERFSGCWPNACIYSSGLFVGAECCWVGDIVRLLPSALQGPSTTTATSQDDHQTDSLLIMKIQKIITKFHNLTPEPTSPNIVTGNRCSKITLTIQGSVYTSDPATSTSRILVTDTSHITKAMATYTQTKWYHLDQPNDIHSASFSSILSRLYESDAMDSYLPTSLSTNRNPKTITAKETEAILQSRSLAAATDERISDPDPTPTPSTTIPTTVPPTTTNTTQANTATKTWFWADNRAEALDLQSVNGLEVGLYDGEREPRVWREVLGVLDGRRETLGGGDGRGGVGGKEGVVEGEEGSGSGSEEEGDEEEEEEESDDDDVVEVEAPETVRKGQMVQVKVPLRG